MKKCYIFLSALEIYGVFLCIGCRDRVSSNEGQAGWYILDPSSYYHVADSPQNEVLYWLQSKPTRRPIGPNLQPSPYNLDEWMKKGREIPNIEILLTGLYRDYTGNVYLYSILEAFRYVGTFRSVSLLIEVIEDSELGIIDRREAIGALSVIGDPTAVPALVRLLHEQDDTYGSSDQLMMKLHAFVALVDIGDPRAISVLEEWLKSVSLPSDERSNYEILLDRLRNNQKEFVQEWILRWHLGNSRQNSKELPFFRSEKKWAIAGKEIPNISRILFEIVQDKERKVSKESVLFAIGAIGTKTDIQPLIDLVLTDSGMTIQEVETAFRSMYDIGGISILDEIVAKIGNSHFINDKSECRIKSAILTVFSGKGQDDKLVSIRKRYKELGKMLYPDYSME